MAEMLRYEGDHGLAAALQALDNLRLMLMASTISPEQAAGYLGCINLHLAQIAGVGGEFRAHLQQCGGLLCPNCKGYVGFISDLSGACHLCGAKLFPSVDFQLDASRKSQGAT